MRCLPQLILPGLFFCGAGMTLAEEGSFASSHDAPAASLLGCDVGSLRCQRERAGIGSIGRFAVSARRAQRPLLRAAVRIEDILAEADLRGTVLRECASLTRKSR